MERFVEVPGGRLFVADDGAGPPIVLVHAATAHRLAEGCPSARAVVVPGVAHVVGVEVPDALAGMIADFLGPLRPWS